MPRGQRQQMNSVDLASLIGDLRQFGVTRLPAGAVIKTWNIMELTPAMS